MLISLAACGGEEDTKRRNKDKDEDKEDVQDVETEPAILDVTIGDYYVVYKGAYEYNSNEYGSKFIVFVEFTNNADQAYMPYTRVYIKAEQDGELISGVEWPEDNSPAPDQFKKDRVELPAGETTNYYNGFYYNPDGGIITVTFMDNRHILEEKLVVEIDPAELVSYEKP
jgi:hypothetical protein